MRRAAAVVAFALLAFSYFAQAAAAQRLSLETWSGLIFLCEADAKLSAPPDTCANINAEAARQAAAAKIKFVALTPGDSDSAKAAKAKAAGFDDNAAIEMRVHLRPPHSPYRAAVIDLDALSRLHPVPAAVAGQPNMFRKIYTQGADPDAGANWTKQTQTYVKLMLQGFFQTYSAPAQQR